MKKKLLATVLSAAMIGSVLSGCGSSAASTDTAAAASSAAPAAAATSEAAATEESTAAATSEAAVATGEVDYSKDSGEIYMFISSPEYADAINTLIDEYKEVAPNVTINYETTQNDYPTLLKAKINSGEIPDIFSSTSGKEIDTYKEYSYDLSDQPLMDTISDSVASVMASPSDGTGMYGIAIKGNYFGMVYNKDIFDEVGITAFPQTTTELEDACEKISAAGYTPFTTGYAEWWVFKHAAQSFIDAAAEDAGISTAELVTKFENGEAKIKDYPAIYDNFFNFLDLTVKYGDDKPLETDLSGEESAFGTGKAAMVVGQGAWIEGDVKSINPDINIGFDGYPVSDNADQCKVISGSDQALHVNKDSENLQATLDFVNWWYTSDTGKAWFTDVAGVVPPIKTDAESDFAIINQGNALAAEEGTNDLEIIYSTDSLHQSAGEILQAYLAGTNDKDETCSQLEAKWQEIDGAAE